jgi:hypothetical protein
MRVTSPPTSGGRSTRWVCPLASRTVPNPDPGGRTSPARTTGVKAKVTGAAGRRPGSTKALPVCRNGRNSPSNVLPISPGPSGIANGPPLP